MKRTVFPPNCDVRNSNPSRLHNFVVKQRRVFAEYGFWLSVKRRTKAEKDGYRRYMRDYRRRYRAEHIDKLKAYRHDYWQNVTKRGFECMAEAVGDEEKLKRRAERKVANQKRAALEARREEVHAKYGFWLGRIPVTPEEVAGRQRYRRERESAYKAAHPELQKKYSKQRSQREKERRRLRFQEKYDAMMAVDPAKAEAMRRRYETLCLIQNMTHEERVRYCQQKQFEKQKAKAARKAELDARREELAAQRRERERIRREAAEARRKLTKREAERIRMEERKREIAAEAAALKEAEQLLEAAYRRQREENRLAYIAAKAAMVEDREKKDYVVDEDTPRPMNGGGNIPLDPPTDYGISTGGSDDDDEEEIRRMREEAARAAQAAKDAEREAMRKARQEARQAAKQAKLEAERKERAEFKAKAKELHLPLQKARWTPAHQKTWDKAMRREARERMEAKRDERRKKRQEEADKKAARAKALEEKRRTVLEKYGFTLGKKPVTPEEIEGRKRYDRDLEAAERERRRDKINEYNREYRRRKRREELVKEQAKWTSEQLAEWNKKKAAKDCPIGSPQWLVREVVKYLALENGIPGDAVMERIIELNALDFLLKGAESFGARRCSNKGGVLAAVRALALYLNPDNAAMFGNRGSGNGDLGTEAPC